MVACHGEKNPALAAALAMLFEAARDPQCAMHFFLQAAEHAVRVSAHDEAIVLADRGRALLPSLPEGEGRERQELALLIPLGVSLVAVRGFASPDVERTYLRAGSHVIASVTPRPCFRSCTGRGTSTSCAEFVRCKELATQLFDLAQGRPDPALQLVAHNALQQPLFQLGELAAARRHQEQGWRLYDERRHGGLTEMYGEDPGLAVSCTER